MADTGFQRVSSAGGLNTQSEKPFHYSYLKEFRVDQCKLFLQHKCTQHRPYTCFCWHFMNQRRRRPVRKKDGTFNYSPDIYCTLYNENTGICPNGDDCPHLHRNAGDTERRYHLRYYKTSTCVYETDSRGFCVKNGPHCAFAHGPHDLRTPVYDIRELTGESEEDRLVSPLVGSLEKEKGVLVDDPRWHDSSFVLTYYKTDQCKRPPRLCRQGYACPFYHNNKDRRRSPKTFKYRSTPCPDVKVNDEWSDPLNCEQKDECCYCHTRTEQQFHPEIYKSTRCNDVQSVGYCPRGPFCAFAHDDSQCGICSSHVNNFITEELTSPRELTEELMTPDTTQSTASLDQMDTLIQSSHSGGPTTSTGTTPTPDVPSFHRAPGAEVRSRSFGDDDNQTYLKKQLQAIENDQSLDENEKQRRKHSLLRLSFVSGPVNSSGMSPDSSNAFQPHSLPSSVSDALEPTIDLSLEDYEGLPADPLIEMTNSSSVQILGQSPVAQSFLQSLHSPFGATMGPLSPFPAPHHIQPLQTNLGLATPTSPLATAANMSPISQGVIGSGSGQSRGMTMAQIVGKGSPSRPSSSMLSGEKQEVAILREELKQAKTSFTTLQESWKHAKQACNAWKIEAEGAATQAQMIERDRNNLIKKMEKLETHVRELESKMTTVQSLASLNDEVKLVQLSVSQLIKLRNQMRDDLDKINMTISSKQAMMCVSCKEVTRSILFQPCQHCILCQRCSDNLIEPVCIFCNSRITNKVIIILPDSSIFVGKP